MAHPAWVEKHTVRREPSEEGMPTVSTAIPSAKRTRYLRVPSALHWRVTMVGSCRVQAAAS